VTAPPVRLYVAQGRYEKAWQETRLMLLDEQKVIGYHDVKARMISVDARPRPPLLLAAVGMNGQVSLASESGVQFEQIDGPGTGSGRHGYCKRIRFIGDSLFVCGDRRQVYVRAGDGWQACDDEIREQDPRKIGCSLNDLDGRDESLIIAVGDRGEIVERHDKTWRRVDSPTNVSLERVSVAHSGTAWACGGAGTLLRGNADRWEVVSHSTRKDWVFWGLAILDEEPYVCSSDGLFRYHNASLEQVALPAMTGAPYRLAADSDSLWLLGYSDLWRYDRVTWHRIELPEP
jgi:hypothetical protein